MRVHFFSPTPSLPPDHGLPPSKVLGRTGGNTGNQLFISALVRQVAHTEASFGYQLDADDINANVGLIVIPAANWLHQSMDLGKWYNWLAPTKVPILIAGLGAQAGLNGRIPELPEGSRAFLRLIKERARVIGTRGAFTSGVLAHYGVTNIATVGCPSLYYHCRPEFPAVRPVGELVEERVVLQGTKHQARPEALHRPGEVATQRRLIGAAWSSRTSYVLQSEREEIELTLGGQLEAEASQRLLAYYGVNSLAALRDFLTRMRVFLDVGSWMAFLSQMGFVCGTRVHGVMASVLAGTPASLFVHDSRTAEMAEIAGLPRFEFEEFLTTAESEGTMAAIRRAAAASSCAELQARYPENYRNYRGFLEGNGVDHKLA